MDGDIGFIKVGNLPAECQDTTIIAGICVQLIRQRTGFGYRRYFQCPTCGRKCGVLNRIEGISGQLFCWKCSPIDFYAYRRNMHDEGGQALIIFHMKKLASSIGISIKFPYCCIDYFDECPPDMRWTRFYRVLEKLSRLENLRVIAIHYTVNRWGIGLCAGFIKDWRDNESHVYTRD